MVKSELMLSHYFALDIQSIVLLLKLDIFGSCIKLPVYELKIFSFEKKHRVKTLSFQIEKAQE